MLLPLDFIQPYFVEITFKSAKLPSHIYFTDISGHDIAQPNSFKFYNKNYEIITLNFYFD